MIFFYRKILIDGHAGRRRVGSKVNNPNHSMKNTQINLNAMITARHVERAPRHTKPAPAPQTK
jgi:hypothetical protein